MGLRRARAGVALTMTLLLGAAHASAQDAGAEARRLFEEGVALLQGGRYADALQRLERVRALRETPAVMLDLALAQRGLGRYVEASRSLGRYLALAQGRIDASRRQEIDALQREIQSALAHLTIRTTGPAATVTLDGRDLSPSELGASLVVDPGVHVVRVAGDGVEPEEVARTVASGETVALSFAVRPHVVTTRLRVMAAGDAEVFVDRRMIGQGSQDFEATPGPHEVEVRAAGYETFRAPVVLTAGRDERVVVTLRRAQAPSERVWSRWWFWTAVGAVAAGATVAVVYATRPTEAPETGSLGYAVGALAVW